MGGVVRFNNGDWIGRFSEEFSGSGAQVWGDR